MKKWIMTALLAVLLIASPTFSSAKQFTDVPFTSSYYEVLDELSDEGVINGYNDGTFRPTATISRAHMAAIISRAFELQEVRKATTFTDVPTTHRYYDEIMALYTSGVLDGSNGQFQPDAQLTRGQLAKILSNLLALDEVMVFDFVDVRPDHQFNGYIGALVEEGVVKGYEDNTFRPNIAVSRQHFSLFIYRILYQPSDDDTDELPVVELGNEDIKEYVSNKRKIETEYGVFYGSPSVSIDLLRGYASAFTDEELDDFERILNARLLVKPVFVVLDADVDFEDYAQYGDAENMQDAMGWLSYVDNVVVLSTYDQQNKSNVDRSLLGHEYFHWALYNLYEISMSDTWVEEALAENMGYAMQDNVEHFYETQVFEDYVNELLFYDELGDMTEHYSMESVVAWALLEMEYGIDKIEEFIQYHSYYETTEEAFESTFNMSYEDLEQLLLDYLIDQAS